MTAWTERVREELGHIPLEPLDRMRALPGAGDYDAGIYFLWRGPELLYVGKSRHIQSRMYHHECAAHGVRGSYRKNKAIPFTRHTCLVVESGPVLSDLDALDSRLQCLERAYIAAYEPPYNCLHQNPST